MEKHIAFDTLMSFRKSLEVCEVTRKASSEKLILLEGLKLAVQAIDQVKATHKKVVLIGNGGSAAIASHQAVDLWKNGGIRATAFNDASLLTCAANDFGYEDVFAKPVEMFCDKGDLLIAISSSGKSPNILRAVQSAATIGCEVIGFSGFNPDNPLRKAGDVNFYIPSHSYGIVETAHLLIVHAAIDEVIRLNQLKEKQRDERGKSEAVLRDASNPPG